MKRKLEIPPLRVHPLLGTKEEVQYLVLSADKSVAKAKFKRVRKNKQIAITVYKEEVLNRLAKYYGIPKSTLASSYVARCIARDEKKYCKS